mmetsp:Transcript_57690/g.134399  ORF Transcript_57690/g.134399 Transcript_57690/m.134399 type:complete len:344 (+) Transcript_57690:52-1083(+)
MCGMCRWHLALAVSLQAARAVVVGRLPIERGHSQELPPPTVQADTASDSRSLQAALQEEFGQKRLPEPELVDVGPFKTVPELGIVQMASQTCAVSYGNTVNGTDELEKAALISRAKTCVADERLLFLHIPKNVGTTIEDVAMSRGIHWGKFMDFDGCHVGNGNCYANWHEPPALMAAINVYTAAKVFCVVRNPYERAVSEYKFVYVNPEYRWDNNDLVEREGCSKEGLNAWLERVLNSYLDGNIFDQLCHMLPQVYYIWGPPDTWGNQCQYCHEILRQEEFPGTFNTLMGRYGYDVRLSEDDHLNVGGCPDLSVKDLSLSNIELMQVIYANDFKWLNYSTRAP